jgi:methylated-DNA-protein-cysteine methyltransferase related protein
VASHLHHFVVAYTRRLDRAVTRKNHVGAGVLPARPSKARLKANLNEIKFLKAMPPPKSNARDKIRTTIRSIPRGKVSTYGAVAKAAGFPRGARQVVAALRNAVGLPWQRVLGAGGAIKLRGDYAFEQRFRLEAEGVTFRGRKVDMKLHEHKFRRKR